MTVELSMWWEANVRNPPKNMSREYFGICSKMAFVVYRPTGKTGECGEPASTWKLEEIVVYMGKVEKLEDLKVGPGECKEIPMAFVKVLSVKRGKDVPHSEGSVIRVEMMEYPDRSLLIETEKGPLYCPDPFVREGEAATLNAETSSHYY